MLIIILLAVIGASACWWILSADRRNQRRREQIMSRPFPGQWRKIIRRRLPFFRGLPDDLKLQLKKHIRVFIAEKEFIGCDGQQINDDVRVTIAAQACLLLLNKDTDYYPKLKQILVYPSAFYVDSERNDNGIVSRKRRVLLGESWEEGKVVLSWPDTLISAADPTDGSNLIFHEFAHQLDQQTGVANGAPVLSRQEDYQEWSRVLSQEYKQLKYCAENQIPCLFDYYGATNPAEFFAVITEVFFEQPKAFFEQHPRLYQQLVKAYALEPLTWDQ